MVTKRRARPGKVAVAVAYIRVSTDKQENGPEAQRAAIEAWAAREGVQIAAWCSEADVCGADSVGERPELARALAELRTHRAGVLIAAKRDRVARDVAVMSAVEACACAAGARVRTADGMSDATGAAGALQRGIVDVFSAYERELIRERTKAAMAVKRARGERISRHAPYGFRVAAARLEEDAGEQATIARARALRARGLTVRAIAEELEVLGLLNRADRPFGVAAVHAMITT